MEILDMLASEFDLSGCRVWVAGHRGMVGAALCRRLASEQCEIVTVARENLDLRRQSDVEEWMSGTRVDVVVIAAATVGGIIANDERPAEFLYDNLMIETNIINASWRLSVHKLLLLGSTCIYPRMASQPIQEESLLTGPLESTNQWYAISKIAGIKLCEAYRRQYGCNFISAQPTNLYGPNDSIELQSSHVLPALIRKIHEAKVADLGEVEIWGTGRPLREFLHVEDLVDALVYLLRHYNEPSPINVGSGEEISIAQLASMISEVVGYSGTFTYAPNKPDGTPRKLADSRRINDLGWFPKINLADGLTSTYRWYQKSLMR